MDVKNLVDSIVLVRTKIPSFVHRMSEFMVRNIAAQNGSRLMKENMAAQNLAICVEKKFHVSN